MLEGETVSSWSENGSNGCYFVDKERCAENGTEDLGGEILVNLESYFDDITDRLTVSRMVSNSVIKGMVNAVEQEAAEKVEAKELEIANLKESLHLYNVDVVGKLDCLGSCMDRMPEGENCAKHLNFDETCLKHDMMMDSLKSLRNVADQQLRKLKNGLHGARSSSIRRINSGSELVGLGGILLEKDSPGFVHVDRILDDLKMTLDSICLKAKSVITLSKSALCDWSQEMDLKSQIEAMVTQSLIQSIEKEFEQKLWDQSSTLSSSQNFDWIEKLNHISSFRKDLDAILKSLSNGEGQLAAYGSHDADHLHRKVLSNHVTSSITHQEGNGKLDSPDSDEPECYDAAQLKHLSKEELVGYFNNIITKMKRNHESTVQKLTEELFSLKREYLKERGLSLLHKKDKEFDMLRKKIPDIILELDNILTQKEKLPVVVSKDADNLGSLKDRLDNLHSENHHLRVSLREKKSELKCMSFQLSDAAEKILQHSSAEIKMLKLIGKLQSDLEDARIGAAIEKDVQKCVVAELIGDLKFYTEELDLEILLKQEIYEVICSGATANVETKQYCELECSDMESLSTQGLNEVIFKETLKDAFKEIKELNDKYLMEKQMCTYFETEAVEMEHEIEVVAEQNGRLKEKISVVTKLLDEKEKAVTEISAALTKEREQHELASRELDSLREEENQQRILASENSKLLESLNGRLLRALEENELDKVEILKLNQKLEESQKDLKNANEQRKMVVADSAQLFEAKERELKMQRELVIFNVQGLLKMLADFEFKVSGQIQANKIRYLCTAISSIYSCISMVNVFVKDS